MNTIEDHYTTMDQEFSIFEGTDPMRRGSSPLGYVPLKIIESGLDGKLSFKIQDGKVIYVQRN